MTQPTASVVIATYRRPDHVRECLEHLARQTVAPVRVIVVDASPDDQTREVVAAFPGVEYRRNDRGIGTTATSRGIGVSDVHEDVVAFIDDDAYAEPRWLERLLLPYADERVAAVGGRALNDRPGEEREGIGEIGLLLPDGRLTGYFAADPGRDVEVDHLLGANMSVRMSAVRELGGIRDFYPGTCLREETDIALRMRRAGMKIVYTPTAVVRHVAGTYARGRRFDTRYRYYGARNHVVLLATTLGFDDPHLRRYLGGMVTRAGRDVVRGLRSVRDPKRQGLRSKARGAVGGVRRASIDLVGTASGVIASVGAASRLRRTKGPILR
ncbi:glycosyltransferase family 2 protein [Agromyces tardus]|jgi:GT2 family glycosyltransferase|uniref:Glycosyltransferase family 2 protein n=1 Tax=Agromyces tardus TaxID=2583849 RepID=A0A3M8AFT5_9MICO|nr:glycosyltransferase family 2 protein [Agromyces tardus]RNB50076.1 glycosyltransferase family 2 protein [Agromyces tardus]